MQHARGLAAASRALDDHVRTRIFEKMRREISGEARPRGMIACANSMTSSVLELRSTSAARFSMVLGLASYAA